MPPLETSNPEASRPPMGDLLSAKSLKKTNAEFAEKGGGERISLSTGGNRLVR